MRLFWSLVITAAASVSAFAPVHNNRAASRTTECSFSAVATADVKAKQDDAVEKLKAKDAASSAVSIDVSLPNVDAYENRRRGRNQPMETCSSYSSCDSCDARCTSGFVLLCQTTLKAVTPDQA